MHATRSLVSRFAVFTAALAGFAFTLTSVPFVASAFAAGPFEGLPGMWSGNGTVTYASGTKERLRCRVQYAQNNPDNLQQALRCASDSYKFEINAYFDNANGQISGHWAELTMDITGTLSGTAATGGQITGDLAGPGFVAQLLVTTKGDRQHVNIAAELEEIRAVDIEVRKSAN
jgi:hypothetical protein